jgi:hypothetical protein
VAAGAAVGSNRQGLPFRIRRGNSIPGRSLQRTLAAPRLSLHVRSRVLGRLPSSFCYSDGFNGFAPYLEHHDVAMIAVPRAPLAALQHTSAAWDRARLCTSRVRGHARHRRPHLHAGGAFTPGAHQHPLSRIAHSHSAVVAAFSLHILLYCSSDKCASRLSPRSLSVCLTMEIGNVIPHFLCFIFHGCTHHTGAKG